MRSRVDGFVKQQIVWAGLTEGSPSRRARLADLLGDLRQRDVDQIDGRAAFPRQAQNAAGRVQLGNRGPGQRVMTGISYAALAQLAGRPLDDCLSFSVDHYQGARPGSFAHHSQDVA